MCVMARVCVCGRCVAACLEQALLAACTRPIPLSLLPTAASTWRHAHTPQGRVWGLGGASRDDGDAPARIDYSEGAPPSGAASAGPFGSAPAQEMGASRMEEEEEEWDAEELLEGDSEEEAAAAASKGGKVRVWERAGWLEQQGVSARRHAGVAWVLGKPACSSAAAC